MLPVLQILTRVHPTLLTHVGTTIRIPNSPYLPLTVENIGPGPRLLPTLSLCHTESRMTVGELNIANQTFYVLDIPSEAGTPQMLVGWEFMQLFAVKMDPLRNEITFFEGTHFRYEGHGKAVPIIRCSSRRTVSMMSKTQP